MTPGVSFSDGTKGYCPSCQQAGNTRPSQRDLAPRRTNLLAQEVRRHFLNVPSLPEPEVLEEGSEAFNLAEAAAGSQGIQLLNPGKRVVAQVEVFRLSG